MWCKKVNQQSTLQSIQNCGTKHCIYISIIDREGYEVIDMITIQMMNRKNPTVLRLKSMKLNGWIKKFWCYFEISGQSWICATLYEVLWRIMAKNWLWTIPIHLLQLHECCFGCKEEKKTTSIRNNYSVWIWTDFDITTFQYVSPSMSRKRRRRFTMVTKRWRKFILITSSSNVRRSFLVFWRFFWLLLFRFAHFSFLALKFRSIDPGRFVCVAIILNFVCSHVTYRPHWWHK